MESQTDLPVRARTRGGLGTTERVIRIAAGAAVAIASVYLALSSGGFASWAWWGAALLGLDFVVTGIRGYCPLYARLGLGRERSSPAPSTGPRQPSGGARAPQEGDQA